MLPSVTPAPVWAGEFVLPGEAKLRAELEGLSKERDVVYAKTGEIESKLASLTAFRRLLYADGNELELAVWSTLERLGAVVHESETPGFEDKWFEAPRLGKKAVLEIKGHEGSMKKEDTRQAEEWVTRWHEKRGEVVKGVLFGNPYRLQPPKDRPAAWPKEMIDFAGAKGLALATTVQLFDAIIRVAKDQTSHEAFFDALFSADGPMPF